MAVVESATGIIITTDTGIGLYRRSVNMNTIDQNNLGILQAFLMTSIENSSSPIVLKTQNGYISYTVIEVDDSRLNIGIFGNTSAEGSEQCIDSVSQLLYFIRNLFIFHIGAKDIEEIKSGNYERLKRQFKVLDLTMDYILSHPEQPYILLNAINVTGHSTRNDRIRFLLQNIQTKFEIGHLALWLENKLYYCSQGWNDIHSVDKCLLYLYKRIKSKAIIYDVPVYLTHTSLVEDPETVGIDPYRYIIMQLSPIFTLTLVGGPFIEVNDLYEYIMNVGIKDVGIELSSKAIMDGAVYYEVPDQILSWMYYDKVENNVRTFTRSELLLKSGQEDHNPDIDSAKSRTRYSRLSKEFEQKVNITKPLKFNSENEDKELKENKINELKQSEYSRDLIRLYLKLPLIESCEGDQAYFEQDSYIIAEDYVLYVVRSGLRELILLFNTSLDIEQISELSYEFNEFIDGLFKKDYIYSIGKNQR